MKGQNCLEVVVNFQGSHQFSREKKNWTGRTLMVWGKGSYEVSIHVLSDNVEVLSDLLTVLTSCFSSELYTLMRDQDDGVKELKLEQENRIFNHCFTGTVPGFIDVTSVKKNCFFSSNSLTPSLFLNRCNCGRVAYFKGESEKSTWGPHVSNGAPDWGFSAACGWPVQGRSRRWRTSILSGWHNCSLLLCKLSWMLLTIQLNISQHFIFHFIDVHSM